MCYYVSASKLMWKAAIKNVEAFDNEGVTLQTVFPNISFEHIYQWPSDFANSAVFHLPQKTVKSSIQGGI